MKQQGLLFIDYLIKLLTVLKMKDLEVTTMTRLRQLLFNLRNIDSTESDWNLWQTNTGIFSYKKDTKEHALSSFPN